MKKMKLRNKQYPKTKVVRNFKEVQFQDKPTHATVSKNGGHRFTAGKIYPITNVRQYSSRGFNGNFNLVMDNGYNGYMLSRGCAHLSSHCGLGSQYIFLKVVYGLVKA